MMQLNLQDLIKNHKSGNEYYVNELHLTKQLNPSDFFF